MPTSPPGSLADLGRVAGLDETLLGRLATEHGVTSVSDLDLLARTNRLRDAPGFGPDLQKRVLSALRRGVGWGERRLLDAGRAAVSRVLGAIQREPSALRLSVAGSVRRMEPVCERVEIVATSTDPAALLEAFAQMTFAESVIERAAGWVEVRLEDGMRARLDAFAEDDRTLVALLVRTGPDDYVAALRERAARRGLRLADDMLEAEGQRVPVGSEEDVFGRIGVPWRPPEIRSVARVDVPPPEDLLRMTDLSGLFRAHTKRGFGSYSLAEMADRAAREGYAWIAVTDRVRPGEVEPIPEAPTTDEGAAEVIRGVEVAILPDGRLDARPDALDAAEVVVAVVDASDDEDVTARACRAVGDPRVHVLGRPEGRVLLGRRGPRIDMPAVLDACAASGVAVEIDGDPHRLDLDERWHEEARRRGIPAVVSADAHDLVGIDQAILGVGCARRGEWRRSEVLNTRTAGDFRAWCRAKRERSRR